MTFLGNSCAATACQDDCLHVSPSCLASFIPTPPLIPATRSPQDSRSCGQDGTVALQVLLTTPSPVPRHETMYVNTVSNAAFLLTHRLSCIARCLEHLPRFDHNAKASCDHTVKDVLPGLSNQSCHLLVHSTTEVDLDAVRHSLPSHGAPETADANCPPQLALRQVCCGRRVGHTLSTRQNTPELCIGPRSSAGEWAVAPSCRPCSSVRATSKRSSTRYGDLVQRYVCSLVRTHHRKWHKDLTTEARKQVIGYGGSLVKPLLRRFDNLPL